MKFGNVGLQDEDQSFNNNYYFLSFTSDLCYKIYTEEEIPAMQQDQFCWSASLELCKKMLTSDAEISTKI